MNASMILQAVIQGIANKNREGVSDGSTPNLIIALKIHTYVTYTMMAHGVLTDAAKVTKLIHSLWKQGVAVEKSAMENFSSSLIRTAGEGVGLIFQAGMIGLDIYELSNAQNEAQKEVFGTQLAFDSAILLTGAAEYGAAAYGVESLSGTLGPLAVPIMGLSIGINALVRINAVHAQEAAAVGEYFYHLKKGYENANLVYDAKKEFVLPTDYIVFNNINFRSGNIEMGSQYIYRGKDGVNWISTIDTPTYTFIDFLWGNPKKRNIISDFGANPGYYENKEEAINIREAVGVTIEKKKFDTSFSSPLLLPVVPKSYISYSYASLAGATSRDDNGFLILRNMEMKYVFHYDFFHGALEKTITKLNFEYEYTSIKILLDSRERHLIMPKIPSEFHGKLNYDVSGYGGVYRIHINLGASFTLQNDVKEGRRSTWIIDAESINDNDIKIYDDKLEINGVFIYTKSLDKDNKIFIVNENNELKQYDLSSSKLTLISIDANKWNEDFSYEQYFNQPDVKKLINTPFIVIHNYKYEGYDVGRAFYDTENKRVIFNRSSLSYTQSSILSVVDGENAYFISESSPVAWQTDVKTGVINAIFNFNKLLGQNRSLKIINLWKEDHNVYIKVSLKIDDENVIATFLASNGTAYLIELSNHRKLLDELALTATNDLNLEFENLYSLVKTHDDKKNSGNKTRDSNSFGTNAILMIDGKDSDGINRRYWIRSQSNTLIKPNIEPSFRPFINDQGESVKWAPPDDLMLVGSLFDTDGTEVFYFYSRNEDKVYRQEGLGQDTFDENNPTAKIISDFNDIEKVNFLENKLIIVNKQGEINQLYVNGRIKLVGVNEKWFNYQFDDISLCSRLDEKFKEVEQPIVLIGLKYKKKAIPAWYFNGNVVIAHNLSLSNKLEFLGFESSGKGAYIFDITEGKLYYQAMADNTVIIKNREIYQPTIQNETYLPNIIPIYPNLTFKSVKKMGKGLAMISHNNEIIYHLMSSEELNDEKKTLNSLVIKGTNSNDVISPTGIADIKQLILSGGEGYDIYKFQLKDWKKYNTIIIDNYSRDGEEDLIILPIQGFLSDLFFEKEGNDIILSDVSHNTLLILREVLGPQAESYKHVKIQIEEYFFYLDIEVITDYLKNKNLPVSFSAVATEQFLKNLDLLNSQKASLLTEEMSQIKVAESSSELMNFMNVDASKNSMRLVNSNIYNS